MKQIMLLCAVWGPLSIFAQKTIPFGYAKDSLSVYELHQGETVQINCDTVYLINAGRYRHYEYIKKGMPEYIDALAKQGTLVTNLKKEQDDLLASYQKTYNDLNKLSGDILAKSEGYVKDLKPNLNLLDSHLQNGQRLLEASNSNLYEANKLIRKSQRLEVWKNIGLVGIGAFVGTLVGFSIAPK